MTIKDRTSAVVHAECRQSSGRASVSAHRFRARRVLWGLFRCLCFSSQDEFILEMAGQTRLAKTLSFATYWSLFVRNNTSR